MGFFRRDVLPGHPDFGKPARCDNPVHFTQTANQLSTLSMMQPDDLKLRLNDINETQGEGSNKELISACKQMLARPHGWLYIYGQSGNAKTVALKALCNHLALKGYHPVVYIKFSRLVDIVRQAYSEKRGRQSRMEAGQDWDNMGYMDRLTRLEKIKVLAIEEFDKVNVTSFVDEFRFDFLDSRYEQALRGETITIFSSNSAPDEFPQAIKSRINDGRFRVVHNTAGDARPFMKRKEG